MKLVVICKEARENKYTNCVAAGQLSPFLVYLKNGINNSTYDM